MKKLIWPSDDFVYDFIILIGKEINQASVVTCVLFS